MNEAMSIDVAKNIRFQLILEEFIPQVGDGILVKMAGNITIIAMSKKPSGMHRVVG